MPNQKQAIQFAAFWIKVRKEKQASQLTTFWIKIRNQKTEFLDCYNLDQDVKPKTGFLDCYSLDRDRGAGGAGGALAPPIIFKGWFLAFQQICFYD